MKRRHEQIQEQDNLSSYSENSVAKAIKKRDEKVQIKQEFKN